ncbi:hypothetical protein [Streptomyces sp. WMMB 322]|uniref:hypothetical protein n=1 Tax=Streptomyces sp. WMMB 322 TaxID=1286821 RepID=UPI0006E2C992|nr:hypothetical protein [Streptomyces sp. WMMB 322]SCK04912.1 hypothetical protein H180DRAFT_00014 [Streptomyces sp. WMMB 322]
MVAQWLGGRRHAWVTLVAAVAVGSSLLLTTGCTDDGTAVASDRNPQSASGERAPSGHPSGTRLGTDGLPRRPVPSDPREAVREAAEALSEYGTSRTRTSMSMASGGTRIAVEGEGRFDYGKGAGRLTVRLPEGTSGARPGERRTVTEIVVPGALYMKNRGAGVPAGKWVRVDTDSLADGNLITAGATDPVSAAELLRGARQVTYDGKTRTAGGTVLRRYRGTLDLAAAARAASGHRREQLEAAAHGFPERVVPFDAQIDGQGRLRKVRHLFTFAGGAPGGREGTKPGSGADAGSGAGGGVAVSSTTWFYGYGVPVKVEMPEPDDIYAGKIAPF